MCQWEPGSNDGEDTIYRLFYEKELTKGISECPDYHTAGKNSCFFDRNHTSIWVDYFLTVVAINNYGNTSSDVHKVDVVDIVKPYPPENVTLKLDLSEDISTIEISWNPFNTDNFGWLTVKYEVRFKKEDAEWEKKTAGVQTRLSLRSFSPGKLYMVQVRCRIDNGLWSEWSKTTFIEVPKSDSERHLWILVAAFSAIPFFAAVSIIFIKRKIIKKWLLPPVPGPKIKGVDGKLLKNGRSEEVARALLRNQVFPSGMLRKNQSEEYLVVYDDNMQVIKEPKHTNTLISSNFHSKSNIHNQLSALDNVESKEEISILDYLVDTSQLEYINEFNIVNTMETEKALYNKKAISTPVENSSSDFQRQEISPSEHSTVRENILFPEKQSSNHKDADQQEECLPDDYTRVKEVNSDNRVLLQYPTARNNAQYRDFSGKKPAYPVTVKVGECAVLNNGYVDNINATIM